MERENAWAGQGPVLLDIGDGVGAVVVTMPAALDEVEVEARPPDHRRRPAPIGSDHEHGPQGHGPYGHGEHGHAPHGHGDHWPHVAVVGRPVGNQLVYSLVFAELSPGEYALCIRASPETGLLVAVRDGEVTFAERPVADAPPPAGRSGSPVVMGTGSGTGPVG